MESSKNKAGSEVWQDAGWSHTKGAWLWNGRPFTLAGPAVVRDQGDQLRQANDLVNDTALARHFRLCVSPLAVVFTFGVTVVYKPSPSHQGTPQVSVSCSVVGSRV
ncbi:hypothetical protein AGOR_G00151990 [Albula goreensis]|uniref:Uncharacterized protein n=1 Tax=Albula goreensis TaxID=1534307 RepID=A0A8T3D6H7_9TELE|nr:hypothetical protein AGOR_G00151990 [Albula goreensis]